MPPTLLLRLAPIVLVAVAGAQQHVVLPAKAGYRENGNSQADYLIPATATAATPAHTQVLNDVAGIPIPQAVFRGLSVRRATNPNPMTAVTTHARITFSLGPRAAVDASATFADNAGTPTTVFNNTFTLPARSAPAAWPAAWETELPFSQPFTYDRTQGRSLCADFVVNQNSTQNAWVVEATGIEPGTIAVELSQPDCLTFAGTPNVRYVVNAAALVPGGRFEMQLTDLPRNVASFATNRLIFGSIGVGGSFGNLVLPFRIANLGLPAHPMCRWTIDDIAMGVLDYAPAAGTLTLNFPIARDPIVAERSFFTQGLCIDTESSTQELRLFPTLAFKWTIGTGKLPPASTVVKTLDAVPPSLTGTVRPGEAPVLRLRY